MTCSFRDILIPIVEQYDYIRIMKRDLKLPSYLRSLFSISLIHYFLAHEVRSSKLFELLVELILHGLMITDDFSVHLLRCLRMLDSILISIIDHLSDFLVAEFLTTILFRLVLDLRETWIFSCNLLTTGFIFT